MKENFILKGVTKSYRKVVLDQVSFSIRKGEFLSIVGPSGSGKTTLLRCIAGLEILTKGSILLNKKPFHSLPPQQRNLSMILQQTILFPQMNVFKNIAFPLKRKKISKVKIQEKVLTVSKWLGIEPLLKRDPSTLSGGEEQRVALARIMVKDSPLFLLDEPLSSLDIQIKSVIQNQIKRIHQETKKTMIYVTHDQMEAMELSDRIAVMNEGKLLQIDTPKNLYNSPKNYFVANFMSEWGLFTWSGNIVEKKISKEVFFKTSDFSICISNHLSTAVSLGIRPENFQVTPQKLEGAHFLFEAKIIRVDFLGSRQKLHFKLKSRSFFTVVSSYLDIKNKKDKYFFSVYEKNLLFFNQVLNTVSL